MKIELVGFWYGWRIPADKQSISAKWGLLWRADDVGTL